MLKLVATTRFMKDIKLARKRGKDIEKLEAIILLLANQQPLPEKQRDHALLGGWNGYRDCHIEPDWLLIYRADTESVYLARTGTHSDLFSR